MRSVFVDTSAFVALRNSSEAEHERAREVLAGLISDGVALFTSNYVFAETYTALMVRVGAEGRERALREPHVRPMRFARRELSGFICVEPAGFAADDALATWVRRGLDFVSGLPVKPARTRS